MKNDDELEKKMMVSEANTESFISYMKRMRQHYKKVASDKNQPHFDDIEVDASTYGFLTNDTKTHEKNTIKSTVKNNPNVSRPTEITTIDLFENNEIPVNSTHNITKKTKIPFITKMIKSIFS